jgi:small subunit ribosomal protein S3Ae
MMEAHTDVKTLDGCMLRLLFIAFTKRRPNQVRKTWYAQSSPVCASCRKMEEIMKREAFESELNSLVSKL